MLVIFVVTFLLRMITWGVSASATGNRALVIAGYCYGLNTMILTLRVFGHLMEASKVTGTTHIALMSIIFPAMYSVLRQHKAHSEDIRLKAFCVL